MDPGCGLLSFVRLWPGRLPFHSVGPLAVRDPFSALLARAAERVEVRSRCQIGSLETGTECPLILSLLRFTLDLVHDPPEQN